MGTGGRQVDNVNICEIIWEELPHELTRGTNVIDRRMNGQTDGVTWQYHPILHLCGTVNCCDVWLNYILVWFLKKVTYWLHIGTGHPISIYYHTRPLISVIQKISNLYRFLDTLRSAHHYGKDMLTEGSQSSCQFSRLRRGDQMVTVVFTTVQSTCTLEQKSSMVCACVYSEFRF